MNYLGYELKNYIVSAVKDLNFTEFTEIQRCVFDEFKTDKNILAKSKTGSGKTHSFLIPIFNSLDENLKEIQATIIAPTKELATQIYKVSQHMASFSPDEINIKLFVSGTDRDREIEKIKKDMPQIVIGTPGKIKDLAIDSNVLKIYTSRILVIDEVDMAFDGGYLEDLDVISSVLTKSKMMFFSATIREEIEPFIKKFMTNVKLIDLGNTNDNKIEHIWIPLKHKERSELLVNLTKTINPYIAIVFVNKKETVFEVSKILSNESYKVGMMHGDLSSRERKRVLTEIHDLKYQYVVATDLAARGIDIEGVTHIINYELPYDYEFYLHRSGRTGRMYKDGIVYSFYEEIDDEYLNNLNKKGIKPKYYEFKGQDLVEYKGRNTRLDRIKPKTDYEKEASKYIPKKDKVKPGYKKKRQAQISELAKRLKKNDQKRGRRKAK